MIFSLASIHTGAVIEKRQVGDRVRVLERRAPQFRDRSQVGTVIEVSVKSARVRFDDGKLDWVYHSGLRVE